ncbi:hypothetical protein VZT92_003571 [Zoarces viviparus]|uniref:Uncharacterized protein n=1 Tax=Zoarces viviparus TaxID=48416 RepID=A0AAW1FTV9_ZOAVI
MDQCEKDKQEADLWQRYVSVDRMAALWSLRPFPNNDMTRLCLRLAVSAAVNLLPTDRHPAGQKSFCVLDRRTEKTQTGGRLREHAR